MVIELARSGLQKLCKKSFKGSVNAKRCYRSLGMSYRLFI